MRLLLVYSVLATGVVAVSFAAVLIRLTDAPALVIATYRLGLASFVVLPVALARDAQGLRSLNVPQILWCLGSALALAVHFGAWIASLSYTSVASSVVLVTTSPLLVAVVSKLAYREQVTRPVTGGIALGIVGGVVLVLGDRVAGGQELYGDLLALIGAVGAGAYLLIGRGVRRRLSNLTYISLVYLGSALLLLAIAGSTGTSLAGLSGPTYGMLLLIALVPQLLGHSSLNWGLGHVSATMVAIAIMVEPIGATLLAWLFLGEAPPWTSVVGGVLVLSGVYLAFRRPGSLLSPR